jgi:hypothetical protein
MRVAGMRESSVAGGTGSAIQPIMGRECAQALKTPWWSGELRPAIGARASGGNASKPALHRPWRDRPAAVRRPRPHRGRIATRS